jgi:hypothetical protein
MNLQRLLEEGRALDDSAREIGGPAWRERRITWLRKEMASALAPEDWRDLGLNPAEADTSPNDADAGSISVRANDIYAYLDNHGVGIAYIAHTPVRYLEGLRCHHPVENHRQLVLWLADIFPSTPTEGDLHD